MPKPKASIIIACRVVDPFTRACVEACLLQAEIPAEILVITEELSDIKFEGNVRILSVGKLSPAAKRNRGVKVAAASIIAFIDSDAAPAENWLSNACHHIEETNTGCVGGPNLNPPQNSFLQKASGDVYAAFMATGKFSIRYRVSKPQDALELPSCNLIVKREIFERIGGFDESLFSGEDAKLCFQIQQLGQRVLYRPDVIVYHHRRPLFLPHARQVWQYATDKAKIYDIEPGVRKLVYWLPTLLIAGLLSCVVGMFWPTVLVPARIVLALYLLLILAESLTRSVPRCLAILAGIILTHFVYGIGFVVGLLRRIPRS